MLLTIEKMIYGGDGLARLPADEAGQGKAVFLPFVLPGEKVEASITEQKRGFARAAAQEIVEPSPHRTQPGCRYFGRCGGCHYQHTEYEQQLETKKNILRETLLRTAKLKLPAEIEIHASPPWNYRNRSRLQVQVAPVFALGYFKMASHELLPVEECPISSPLINRGIAVLWRGGRDGRFPAGVREVEFFANAEDSEMLVEVSCSSDCRRASLRSWAEDLRATMPEIAGIVALRQASKPNQQEQVLQLGSGHLQYSTARGSYRVSHGSFFQVNRFLIDELIRVVTKNGSGELVVDLYAGVGLFSTALAGDIRHIVSVEASQTSAGDLAYNLGSNGEAVRASTEQYLARPAKSGRVGNTAGLLHTVHRPALVVVDPPRSGLGERVARMLATLGVPRVVYVSCDPATLARDLVVLLASGYRIEEIHLFDLFPQTFHLETVVHLVR